MLTSGRVAKTQETEALEHFIEKTGWPRPRFKRLLEAFEQEQWVMGLRNHSHWKAEDIKALQIIQANWVPMRDELLACHTRDLFQVPADDAEHHEISGWTILPFFMRRALYEDNLADCPTIAGCLETMRKTAPIAAMWGAMMEAGTELPLHTHPDNTRLRAHFMMRGCEDAALQVEDEVRPFVEGEALVLEPCLEHRAWNRDPNGRARVVLSVDFWHPLLSLHEVAALQFVERALND